jgi:AcrR family transcriptional regulator
LSKPTRTRLTADERRELVEQAALDVFAERGYRGASMGEIAKRAGVTVPVVYDHAESKLELYRRLLERTRNGLLEMWRDTLFGDAPFEVRIRTGIEAWAAFVADNRGATRMYFREASGGDPEAEAIQREIAAQARVALAVILGQLVEEPHDQEALEMRSEIIRSGLVGLALWWYDHQHVPREQIVAAGLDVLWRGYLSDAGQTIR